MIDTEGHPGPFPSQYQNPPLTGDLVVANKAWHNRKSTPFDWWQCQLNFAIWCATSGCGVSYEDHLQAKNPLLRGLYTFHVYYTTRRILEELCVTLPGDKSHEWYENAYNARGYKRLCTEFGVSSDTDWRQKLDHGCQGLGLYSTYMEPSGAYRHSYQAQGPFFHPIDAIRHNRDISRALTTFILDNSNGFTKAGVERLNDISDVCLGHPAGAIPDALEHSQGRDGVRRSKAVPCQRRRCHCLSRRHPIEHRPLSEHAPVCIHSFGLRLWDRALLSTERYGAPLIAGSDAAIGHNPGINESEPVVPTARSAGKVAPPAGTSPSAGRAAVAPALRQRNRDSWV